MDSISPENTEAHTSLLSLSADIVAAYISNNAVPASELPTLIKDIHANLTQLATGATAPVVEPPKEPAVPIKKSISNDFIICLEDGKKFKSLKRHLMTAFGLTPQAYRTKWGLPSDYPMVAPGYSSVRSSLAKQAGLGVKAEDKPQSAPKLQAAAKPAKKTTKKAA